MSSRKPPSPGSHDGPDCFNKPKRPGTLKESVNRAQRAGAGKGEDEPGATLFQRVADKHCGYGEKAKNSKAIQNALASPLIEFEQDGISGAELG